jgi:hypothetical protein
MTEEKASFDDAERSGSVICLELLCFSCPAKQTVFISSWLLIGASLAAFAATIDKPAAAKLHNSHRVRTNDLQLPYRRLDERSRQLIQLAEASLKEIEVRLTDRTGLAWLNILARSENKTGGVFKKSKASLRSIA